MHIHMSTKTTHTHTYKLQNEVYFTHETILLLVFSQFTPTYACAQNSTSGICPLTNIHVWLKSVTCTQICDPFCRINPMHVLWELKKNIDSEIAWIGKPLK